ncbi:MAG: sulfotransferase [Oceanicaulis sp.]
MQADRGVRTPGRTAAVTPVFLLSAPRSGSTLLQRLLAAHPRIHSMPETWLAPAAFMGMSAQPAINAASTKWTRTALDETERRAPGLRERILRAAGAAMVDAFDAVSPDDAVYFLEKTPRNTLVLPQIIAAFPSAKFVFLWRNPLAIRASMNTTWSKGAWHFRCKADLYEGLAQMTDTRARLAGRGFDIRYEALVENPQAQIDALLDFLGLDPISVEDAFESGGDAVRGGLGDPGLATDTRTGVQASNTGWVSQYGNPVRRLWARRYLAWLGDDRLRMIGCERAALLAELANARGQTTRLASDLLRCAYAFVNERVLLEHWFRRRAGALSGEQLPLD